MFRKKWEVYRTYPESWYKQGEFRFSLHWTRKGAEKMADSGNSLRNGRSDEDFAAFKVRKVG